MRLEDIEACKTRRNPRIREIDRQMSEVPELLRDLRARGHQVDCRLGPIKLRLQVPSAACPALNYFVDTRDIDSPDYELFVVDDDPWIERVTSGLGHCVDKTLRARRFGTGHYLLHHHAQPALKVTASAGRTHIVAGPTASTTVWAYYLKYFISHYGACHGAVHTKAAAIADQDGNVTLIIGRSGGGKSVLMHQLMKRGMRFLSNTHVLVRSGHAYGILTAVRARRGSVFDRHIETLPARHHETPDELLLRPQDMFGARTVASGPIRNIVVAQYGSPDPGVRHIGEHEVEAMLTQFAQGLNVYGLKDDVLHLLNDDLQAFASLCRGESREIASLSSVCRAFGCNVDADDERQLDALFTRLSA